jgi:hypothetical protein
MSHWVEEGKQLLKAGKRVEGERALRIAVKEDERSVEAWLWLARAVQSDAERITCLLKVMELDPRNAVARRTLAALEEKSRSNGGTHVDPFNTEGTADAELASDPFMAEGAAGNIKIEKLPESAVGKESPFALHSEVDDGKGPRPRPKFDLRSLAKWVIILLILLGIALIVGLLVLISK